MEKEDDDDDGTHFKGSEELMREPGRILARFLERKDVVDAMMLTMNRAFGEEGDDSD